MARFSGTAYDQAGRPLPGALILVKDTATGSLVALQDDNGGSLLNPVTSGLLGGFVFNVPDGYYDLSYSFAGRGIRDELGVKIGSPVGGMEAIPAGTLLGNPSGATAAPVAVTVSGLLGFIPANKAGDTFTGQLRVRPDTSSGGGDIVVGTATASGYLRPLNPDGTAAAYIGYTVAGMPTTYGANPQGHDFKDGPLMNNGLAVMTQPALAASGGSALVGFVASGSGAVARTMQAKVREQWVSVTDFGAVADSNGTPGNGTDNLAAFNAALASGARTIFVPAAAAGMAYRLSDCWNLTCPVYVVGEGSVPYVGAIGTRGAGSWLYCDHIYSGVKAYNSAVGDLSGGKVSGLGFIRNQPAFASGWAPNGNDYDLVVLQGEWFVDDICFWNSTQALLHDYAGYGRLRVGHIYGNPFFRGITIDRAYDMVRIGSVHWWPYSTFNADAAKYKFQNFIPLEVGHTDGLWIRDFFSINGKHIWLHKGADNQPPRDVRIDNLYCDLVGYAGVIADSTASGGSLSIGQIIAQGAVQGGAGVGDGNPGQPYVGVQIDAPNFVAKIGHARFTRFGQQMALVSGAGSTLYVGPDTIDQWNMGNVSASAYAVTGSGSRIVKTALSTVLTSGGSIGDGSGKVYQPTFGTI